MPSHTKTALHRLETGGSISLKRYYDRHGIPGDWDSGRVLRLCKLMKLSDYELATMFCIEYHYMKRWMRADKFPPYVALHFALLENWVAQQRIGNQDPVIEFP